MGGTPKKRKPKTPARRIESDDEPSDGNDSPYARLPSEQRMSKEKQKFFRFSAFNLVKRRRCRASSSEWEGWEGSQWGGVRVTRVQRLELRLERRPPSRHSSSDAEPAPSAPPQPTIFERLASDTGGGGAWGFAAEAQKQRLVDARVDEPVKRTPEKKRTPDTRWSPDDRRSLDERRVYDRRRSPVVRRSPDGPETLAKHRSPFKRASSVKRRSPDDRRTPERRISFETSRISDERRSPDTQRSFDERRSPEIRKTVTAESARHRRRSRCGDRLLTTLFDGLSEFYSVSAASRSATRARASEPGRTQAQAQSQAQAQVPVLKETRSTFKRYQAALSETRAGAGRGVGLRLSASALVVRAAEGKRGGGDDAQAHKLARTPGPATNQTGKMGSGGAVKVSWWI